MWKLKIISDLQEGQKLLFSEIKSLKAIILELQEAQTRSRRKPRIISEQGQPVLAFDEDPFPTNYPAKKAPENPPAAQPTKPEKSKVTKKPVPPKKQASLEEINRLLNNLGIDWETLNKIKNDLYWQRKENPANPSAFYTVANRHCITDEDDLSILGTLMNITRRSSHR